MENIQFMTKKSHSTGSDRTAELSKKFNYPWILNLQGDEPLIDVGLLQKFAQFCVKFM